MGKIPTVDSWSASMRAKAASELLEPSSVESDHGSLVGKDPRQLSSFIMQSVGIAVDASPMEVIRAKCLDCCGEQESEVRKCVSFTCPNWPYRMGWNPFRKPLSDEERARRSERLTAMRAKQSPS